MQPANTPAPVPSDVPRRMSVDHQILLLLANQVTKVPWPVGAAAAVVCIMAWDSAPHWALLTWAISIWFTQGVRWRILSRLPLSRRPMAQRIRIAIALSALNGLCHAGSAAFFPYLTEGQRSVVTLIMAGITTGAVGTTAGQPRIFLAFALPTMLSLSLAWAVTPLAAASRWIGLAMALFLLAYLGILISLARGAYSSLQRSIAMQIKQWRLNRDLRQALTQAEEANAAKTRFLASASHDLRQPLHTLTLFTAALHTHALTPRARHIIGQMDDALAMLRDQLTGLLDISKLDAGIITARCTPVDIVRFAHRMHDEFAPLAQQKQLQLTLDLPSHPQVYVDSDPLLLERIVRNLLDNAVKYCDAGSVWLRIQVPQAEPGRTVHLIVQDTGRGIPTSEAERVFEEFYQLDNPERDRTRGLGLGLAIVRRLTSLLGIPLSLTSEPGIGTRVTLTIARSSNVAEEPDSHTPSTCSIPHCHVLVIDDEPSILMAMKSLLEARGCRVTAVTATDEAMQQAVSDRPDLVLADFRLRGQESGIKAIRKLRQVWPDLPALLISGDTTESRLKEAHEAGLRLLHKPVSVEVLLKAISESL